MTANREIGVRERCSHCGQLRTLDDLYCVESCWLCKDDCAPTGAMRFAYADPPYLGCCHLYDHRHEPPFGCWDDPQTHGQLIEWLCDQYPDGWALSLSSPSLRTIHNLCPDDVRVAPWGKKFHQIRPTTVQYAWEPVIWRGGRKNNKRKPMVRDWFVSSATRQRGLVGAKPLEFNRWVLDLLNARDGDEVVDMFPGTGGMRATLDRPTLFGAVS